MFDTAKPSKINSIDSCVLYEIKCLVGTYPALTRVLLQQFNTYGTFSFMSCAPVVNRKCQTLQSYMKV